MSRCSTIGSVFIPLSTIEHLSRHGWPWKGSPGLPRNALISPLHSQGGSPGVRCLRFTSGVATTHARLASGWRAAAFAGRESNPLERDKRFQVTSILLPRTLPDANWWHVETSRLTVNPGPDQT